MEHSDAVTKSTPARSRLGKGLGALLSRSNQTADESQTDQKAPVSGDYGKTSVNDIRRLPVADILPNPFQPRRQFNDESLQSLAASLLANGLVQPIVVAKRDNHYELIAGERRLRAAKLAGLTDIPVIVREVSPDLQARLALIENIHREDLNPIERANSYRMLMKDGTVTQQALATLLGEQRSTIANHVRLLDLAEPVQNFVQVGRLSLGHAKVLAAISDAILQNSLAERAVTLDWSVRQLEEVIADTDLKPAVLKKPKASNAHLDDLAKQLSHQLGVRVQLQAKRKGTGSIVLHYASLDQFDQLMLQLGTKLDEA